MKPVILTFTGFYLPGFKAGGPIQTIANIVERLGDEFDFRIVTSDRDLADKKPYASVQVNNFNSVGKAFVYYASPDMTSFLNLSNLINETPHDVLYLNSFFDPRFTIRPLLLRRIGKLPDKPVILAPRGEFSEGAIKRKWSKWIKKMGYLTFAKITRLYKDVIWQASSEYEERDIRRCFGDTNVIHLAPDITSFPEDRKDEIVYKDQKRKVKDCLRVVFLSRICPMKNLDGALRILKKVKWRIEMNIYGPVTDEAYWDRCQKIIKLMPNNVTVYYKGSVPHDLVAKTIAEHDLFFLPTLGENFGHVIFEALSAGVPVLISDQTPWQNLENYGVGWVRNIKDIEGFIKVINEFMLKSKTERLIQREKAKEFAIKHFNKSSTVQANRSLFKLAL